MRLWSRFPYSRQLRVTEPTISRLDRFWRLHSFHWADWDVAATDRPTKEASRHREYITPVGNLLFWNLIHRNDDIRAHNLWQRPVAKCWNEMQSKRAFNQRLPTLACARLRKAIGICRKWQLGRFPPPLLLQVDWIAALPDKSANSHCLHSSGCRSPWRTVAPDRVALGLRFSATHSILEEVALRARRRDLHAEAFEFVVPKERGGGSGLKAVDRFFADSARRHVSPPP